MNTPKGAPFCFQSATGEELRDADDLPDPQVVRIDAGIDEHDRPDRGVKPAGDRP